MHTPRYCLNCDDGTLLVHEKKDVLASVEGASVLVPAVSGWHCPVCGEIEFDAGEGVSYSKALELARTMAVESRASELRTARKRLGLSQAEAGRLFGGGVSAFSEYERGKTQPHKSTVLLLRLLGKHPELLKEVR